MKLRRKKLRENCRRKEGEEEREGWRDRLKGEKGEQRRGRKERREEGQNKERE